MDSQPLIQLWRKNKFIPGQQNITNAIPKKADARNELFNKLIEDRELIQDVRCGIDLLLDACDKLAQTRAYSKDKTCYSSKLLITYDFLLVAHVLRLFFPPEMMRELRKASQEASMTKKRSIGGDQGPNKKAKLDTLGDGPMIKVESPSILDFNISLGGAAPHDKKDTVVSNPFKSRHDDQGLSERSGFNFGQASKKRHREDADEGEEGLSEKSGFNFGQASKKRRREDENEAEEGLNEKSGFNFGQASKKRRREDENEEEEGLGEDSGFNSEWGSKKRRREDEEEEEDKAPTKKLRPGPGFTFGEASDEDNSFFGKPKFTFRNAS